MFEASHLQHNIVSGHIQIVADGRYSPAFWAHPQLGGPFPGLVLLHDDRGLGAHVRIQARRFAEQGYYVIAPDLIGSRLPDNDFEHWPRLPVDAALDALKTHHHCNGKLGLFGWERGGVLALNSALTRQDLQAVVTFDGLPEGQTDDRLVTLPCAVLAVFAGAEPAVAPERVHALEALSAAGQGNWSIVTYPNMPPGFWDDSREIFEANAAQDAWQHALSFLNDHLGTQPPPERDVFDTGNVY